MNKLYLLLGVSALLIMVSCKETAKETELETVPFELKHREIDKENIAMTIKYQCPMDCEKGKTYLKEGICPVCKMDLIKIQEEATQIEQIDENHKDVNHSSEEH